LPTYQEGGYSIEIDWSNYKRIVGEIAGVPDKLAELTALALEKALKEKAPKGVTGKMRKAWRADRRQTSYAVLGGLLNLDTSAPGSAGGEWVVGNPYAYAAYVNDGTRPHCPPKEAIEEWAEFRGLPWFVVWRSICLRGTKANPYIDESIEQVNREIPTLVNEALYQMQKAINGGSSLNFGGGGL
jgi:hypothetical protein